MTGPAALEQRYRRLLAWYPEPFRREREEEVLAVLLASARPGQRRPGLLESADLIRSALGMRLRAAWSGSANQGWADALAVFSVIAPLFLLAVDILEIALPYHLPPSRPRFVLYAPLSGPLLLRSPGFDFAVGGQAIIAALVLLGLRRTALAATAAFVFYWIAGKNAFAIPLVMLLATSVCILAAAALIASPGPRRGRHLMNWGHVVVLLLAAAAVKVWLVLLALVNLPPWMSFTGAGPDPAIFLVIAVVLMAAATVLMMVLRLGWYFLLLFAAMLYPYAIQMVRPSYIGPWSYLFAVQVSGGQLILLYLPPVLFAVAAVATAVMPIRVRALQEPGPDEPGLA